MNNNLQTTRRFTCLIIFLSLSLLTTTCSPDNRLTLRLSSWSSPSEMEIMESCIKLFEQRYPEVRVIHEVYPSGYLDKILTSMAAGTPPDVILLDSVHIPTFIENDVLTDLAPYAERVGIDLDKFYPNVLGIAKYGEKLFAFPKDFTPLVYYYNKKLFDQTGTPYPQPDWTWDDFLQICKQLTGDDNGDGKPDRFGTNLHRELFRWQPWVWLTGGDILSRDGRKAVGYFDAPATVEAFKFLTDLVTLHKVTPRYESIETLSSDYDRPQKMFYSGRIGLLPSGHWWIPKLRKYMSREMMSVGIVPFPRYNSTSPQVTVMFESGWAVPTATRHRKWAIRLAAFMADEETQRIRGEMGLAIPAMPAVAEEIADHDPTGLSRAFVNQVRLCRQPWGSKIPKFTKVEDVAPEIFDLVILKEMPVDEAARLIAPRVEAVLADVK